MSSSEISPTAKVASNSVLGLGVRVWDFSQLREGCSIGENSIIGRNVYIGPGVMIGANCKIQNNSLIYEPAILENGVFVGPDVVLTNDQYPRAINPNGALKSSIDWNPVGVTIKEGASIGAKSVCVAPVVIGAWALVAAGSTVVKDVSDYSLVAGNPAKQIGWVGRAGQPLKKIRENQYQCPLTSEMYELLPNGNLVRK